MVRPRVPQALGCAALSTAAGAKEKTSETARGRGRSHLKVIDKSQQATVGGRTVDKDMLLKT